MTHKTFKIAIKVVETKIEGSPFAFVVMINGDEYKKFLTFEQAALARNILADGISMASK